MFTDPEANKHHWNNITSGWSYSWKQDESKGFDIMALKTSCGGDLTIKLY